MTETPAENERIIVAVAEALGWSVSYGVASRDPSLSPSSYEAALILGRGDFHLIVLLSDIEGDSRQARDELHYALRLMACHHHRPQETAQGGPIQ